MTSNRWTEHDLGTATTTPIEEREASELEGASWAASGDGSAIERIEVGPSQTEFWPSRLGPEALSGLAGDVVSAIEPSTEGDPNAILLEFLACFGSLLGSRPHLLIDERRHPLKVWVLVVGATASGKKGTGLGRVLSLLDDVDPSWKQRRRSGIASGEAIVHHVRDDSERVRRARRDGCVEETAVVKVGEADKRLLLKEEEFSRVLRLSAREGSTFSALLREAWDHDVLMTTSKTAPEKATGAHVVIVGHITPEELRRDFSRTDLTNGFANRFLFACSRRSKRLVRPLRMPAEVRGELVARLKEVQAFVDGLPDAKAQLGLSDDAWARWAVLKPEVEDAAERAEAGGLVLSQVISRGPPYILRLAALYAVLDRRCAIAPADLDAAREVWRYSVESAQAVLVPEIADEAVRRVLAALAAAPGCRLTRSRVSTALGRNRPAEALDGLRSKLLALGRIEAWRERAPGAVRPVEWWGLRSTS
jgi:hypothetical protein